MCKLNELVYDFREHGLYYRNTVDDEVTQQIILTIDTLQIDIDYSTGSILSISGYLPLFNANRIFLDIPQCISGEFVIEMSSVEYISGIAYDFFKYFSSSEVYFLKNELPIISYDETNKRILIGELNDQNDSNIQVNRNIICSLDSKGNLKSILLLLDEIIF